MLRIYSEDAPNICFIIIIIIIIFIIIIIIIGPER